MRKRKETEAEHKYNGHLQTLGEGKERKGREQIQKMRLTYGDGDGHIIFEIRGSTRGSSSRDQVRLPQRQIPRQGDTRRPRAGTARKCLRIPLKAPGGRDQLSNTKVVMGPKVLNHFGPGKGKARDMADGFALTDLL